MLRLLACGFAALLLISSAQAQQNFGLTPSNTSTQSISVTTSSSSITLDTKTGTTVVIANTGSNTAYITNTATATTTGFPIPAGNIIAFNFQPGSVISAITGSSTTTLLVGKGSGATAFAGGGSGGGGGGGAVTIADGADVTEGAIADASSSVGGTGTLSAKLRRITTQLDTIQTAVQAAIPPQSDTTPIGGVGICDGANGATNPCTTAVTVKAASTPAAATDKAVVVDQRPGTTVPVSAASLPLPSGAATSALQGTDPCVSNAKTTLPITLATAAVKVIAIGVSAKKIYVCQLNLNNNAADTVAVFEATTATVCVTAAVAVVGAGTSVATAGTGYNFAATGGISLGNGGAQVLQTATNANDLCIAQSAATQLSGSITYVTQ